MILNVEISPYYKAYRLPKSLRWIECDYINDLIRLKQELINEHNSKLTSKEIEKFPYAYCSDVDFYVESFGNLIC